MVERLDKHGDGFRSTAVDTVEVKQEGTVKLPPRAGAKTQAGGKQADKQNAGGGKKPAPKRKSKADKVKKGFIVLILKLVTCTKNEQVLENLHEIILETVQYLHQSK